MGDNMQMRLMCCPHRYAMSLLLQVELTHDLPLRLQSNFPVLKNLLLKGLKSTFTRCRFVKKKLQMWQA